MAFLEDPRLRQRWNQLSHTTEAVTENAAAGIWTFQHRYLSPCLGAVAAALDACTAPCLGDREERARRRRERARGARLSRAEFSFDFYDDWDDDDELLASGGFGYGSTAAGAGGLLGSWGGGGGGGGGGSRAEDWDRLLAGTGSSRGRHTIAGEAAVDAQPRRKRGMSYGGAGARRRPSGDEDPTVIPSTAPLGFLSRLPWRFGGTLRYKPSAANLQDNPGGGGGGGGADDAEEHRPLLGGTTTGGPLADALGAHGARTRSGTTGSGDTSDSFRSRGDLFPSDEEGEEDAVPIDDEFAVTLGRVGGGGGYGDDRSSAKTRSSSGRRADRAAASRNMSRTVSVATLSSERPSLGNRRSTASIQQQQQAQQPQQPQQPPSAAAPAFPFPSLEDLRREEDEARRAEDHEVERKRQAAAQLALERGLSRDNLAAEAVREMKAEVVRVEGLPEPESAVHGDVADDDDGDGEEDEEELAMPPQQLHRPPVAGGAGGGAGGGTRDDHDRTGGEAEGFVPARLPRFG